MYSIMAVPVKWSGRLLTPFSTKYFKLLYLKEDVNKNKSINVMKHRKMSFGRISFYFVFFLLNCTLYIIHHLEFIDMHTEKTIKKNLYFVSAKRFFYWRHLLIYSLSRNLSTTWFKRSRQKCFFLSPDHKERDEV